ncbi:MAG: putative bacterial DnaA helix-turn-helix protein [Prokaryotic dsDNA virus sp.]|nr:MAG: putative bacterial DnaA helix-turn-helix protein [Prokaryotic dsDNA virus sp.]|tara:strand:+ start:1415 stop:1870 length:456 start_codon:yes stop_codon:yes gene_type:complete
MNKYKLEFTRERDEKIKAIICERYNLSWSVVEGRSRVRKIVDARRLYSGVLRDLFCLSYQKIAKILNKNHATIIHNVQQHEVFVKILKSYRKNYEDIERTLMLDDNYYIHEVKEVERKMNELSERLNDLIEKKNNYKLKIKNKEKWQIKTM